jgi:aspartate carbamoyltransferase catalytic subunit
MPSSIALDAERIKRSLMRIAHEIVERNLSAIAPDALALVGIRQRGVPLAKRLAANIQDITGSPIAAGALDITLYRDDLMRHAVGHQPIVRSTEIPFSIDDRRIVLVDDVLYTGRTIRAAIDALIDFGRPSAIQLVVLVDRGHRELPIKPDYVGKNLPTSLGTETPVSLSGRHLLGIADLTPGEIALVLDTAEAMKEIGGRAIKKVPTLRGRTVVNLFFEPSTRTRMSFEIAEKRLSADTLNFAASTSSVSKGETLADTARNLEAMAPDIIVVRHASSGAAHLLSRVCRARIVNAGDGMHEHPTQALLDAFTIRERKGRLDGLKVAIVGDLLHSRVLRSNLLLLTRMGAQVWACGPATLLPAGLDRFGARLTHAMDEALDGADVVMMLRVQHERMKGLFLPSVREYFNLYGLTEERLRRASRDVIVMHPGPMNRGVEIDSKVADGPWSVILDQVANGVAVRMAVLYLMAGESDVAS